MSRCQNVFVSCILECLGRLLAQTIVRLKTFISYKFINLKIAIRKSMSFLTKQHWFVFYNQKSGGEFVGLYKFVSPADNTDLRRKMLLYIELNWRVAMTFLAKLNNIGLYFIIKSQGVNL